MGRFFSKKYDRLKPYTPEEAIQQKKTIVLNRTESPYPASPFVYRSIDQFEIDNLRMYSDSHMGKLIKVIAEHFGINENQIAVGNGSNEILALAFMVFQNEGRKFYFPEMSNEFYAIYSDAFQVNKVEIPLSEELSINPEDYFDLDGTIVLTNPNIPTGMALATCEIEKILSTNPNNLVIIDEAYVDFGAESCIPLVERFDNLMVVQTLSKSRNLAGARVGFAIANAEIISDLNRIKHSFDPYSINTLSLIAGTAAMKDKDYFKKGVNDVKKTRENFSKEMKALGFTVLDSKANFVLVKNNSLTGEEYCEALRNKNILVKHYTNFKIKDYVRITIGTFEQMESFIKVTKDILGIEEEPSENL
ncbi:histidinol-phosphate transaminase [Aminipila luticellarii]|uniref:Histidinol-phosphate transaminase n=1 Tax=Aminipila luticellarii TaxID=2507160 RepID=A0A410PSI4_9FIRM|nr:histidinol-phosphate transaminase [Aminipila luticellarii]QAT41846.1 histidinol-phosphate transaminase [Aminipila luticellarii]